MFRCPAWALELTAGTLEALLAFALRDTFAEVAGTLTTTGHLLVVWTLHLATLALVSCLTLACCLGALPEVACSVPTTRHLTT